MTGKAAKMPMVHKLAKALLTVARGSGSARYPKSTASRQSHCSIREELWFGAVYDRQGVLR